LNGAREEEEEISLCIPFPLVVRKRVFFRTPEKRVMQKKGLGWI